MWYFFVFLLVLDLFSLVYLPGLQPWFFAAWLTSLVGYVFCRPGSKKEESYRFAILPSGRCICAHRPSLLLWNYLSYQSALNGIKSWEPGLVLRETLQFIARHADGPSPYLWSSSDEDCCLELLFWLSAQGELGSLLTNLSYDEAMKRIKDNLKG